MTDGPPNEPSDDESGQIEEAERSAGRAFQRLDELGIRHETCWHAPHRTVEESRADRGGEDGGHTKNLFLKDKKGRLFLLTARDDTELDLKQLHRAIGASGRVSFGSEDAMVELLGVRPGSVTALAVMNDTEGEVTMIVDARLLADQQVHCHPLTNRATTTLATDDLLRFLEASGHAPQILKTDDVPAK